MNYHASTVNKHRYKPSAMGDGDALSDLYLTIDEIGEDPPRTIEVLLSASSSRAPHWMCHSRVRGSLTRYRFARRRESWAQGR
jgi:hypothetical protein